MTTDYKWSAADKKTARRLYDAALAAELAEVLADFKARAAAAEDVQAMWAIHDHLRHVGRELEGKYVYTYSRLDWLLLRLVHEGRLSEADLDAFSPGKREELGQMLDSARAMRRSAGG
ncbi:MAG: hypothetical protein Q4G71_08995 [Pseudomonadota bacterium]|nr:hypothetical protein [Pseudomonadota bacterium]